MKKDRLKWMLATGLLGLLGFSSCTKPEPEPEPVPTTMYGPPPGVYMYGPRPSSYQTLSQESSPSGDPTVTGTPELEIPKEE